MIRLFIAWPLPHQVEQELGRISFLLKQKNGRVSWVASKNIHLTARFLGDTDEKVVPNIGALINEVAKSSRPVECTLDRLGAFPDLNRPRVIWVGLAGDIESLQKMADRLETGVRQLEFAEEPKRFRPHLTLARVREQQQLDGLIMAVRQFRLTPMPFTFDKLVLFKSTLTPSGSIYERLHEAALHSPERFS
jgi:2'-5' RNA ligase